MRDEDQEENNVRGMKEKEEIKFDSRKKKQQSSTLTARNKAELLVLEGGCVECSRWKKQEEMWKITYYAWFRKWLDSCTVLSLFFHFIFLRSVTAIKYYFPPMNLLISAIDKSRLPFIFSTLTCSPARLLLIHILRALICLHIGQNTYFILQWWVDGGVSAISLPVYTPVPVASACDSWYALMASLFSMDRPLS